MLGPRGLNRFAMGQIDHMGRRQGRSQVLFSGRMLSDVMAQVRGAPGFIKGGQRIDPVTQAPHDMGGVLRKCVSGVPVGPPTIAHQRQGQIPVVKRRKHRDIPGDKSVDQAIIEIQPGLVHMAAPFRQDPRPCD